MYQQVSMAEAKDSQVATATSAPHTKKKRRLHVGWRRKTGLRTPMTRIARMRLRFRCLGDDRERKYKWGILMLIVLKQHYV